MPAHKLSSSRPPAHTFCLLSSDGPVVMCFASRVLVPVLLKLHAAHVTHAGRDLFISHAAEATLIACVAHRWQGGKRSDARLKPTKTCKACKLKVPAAAFFRHANNVDDGMKAMCSECLKIYKAALCRREIAQQCFA